MIFFRGYGNVTEKNELMIRKANIFYPLIRTRTCSYQEVRNVSFFGKFCERTKWMIPYKLCCGIATNAHSLKEI